MKFLYSLFFFLRHAFLKKHYSIVFYSPHHFNRGEKGQNLFFKKLIEICDHKGISYIFFEEPYINSNFTRSNLAIPFDFIYYFVVFLRKLFPKSLSDIEKDRKIGRYIKALFLKRFSFDNFITISQSMLSVFYGINNKAKLFDLQHGTIHASKDTYLINGLVSDNLKQNDVYLFLSGLGFKNILVNNEHNKYFDKHSIVIGSLIPEANFFQNKKNKNVLVSLQFTNDHSDSENNNIAQSLLNQINQYSDFHFFLRKHPRFNNEFDLSKFTSIPNVSIIDGKLQDNLRTCSIHLTTYSTVVFEAALLGIPSSFLKIDNFKMNIFSSQYNYPYYDYNLKKIYDNYDECSFQSKQWVKSYYESFSNNNFFNSLKNEK